MSKCVLIDNECIICMSTHDEEAPFVGAKERKSFGFDESEDIDCYEDKEY